GARALGRHPCPRPAGLAGSRAAAPHAAAPRAAGPRAAGPRAAGPRAAGPRAAGPRTPSPGAGGFRQPACELAGGPERREQPRGPGVDLGPAERDPAVGDVRVEIERTVAGAI